MPSTNLSPDGRTVLLVVQDAEWRQRKQVDLRLGAAHPSDCLAALSTQEVAVLSVLLSARGRVVGRHELQRRAGLNHLSSRRCDALIVGLRRCLGPENIATVRGRGWRCLAGPVTSVPA
jgi:DNA-binding response OmpR family regulator